MLFRNLTVKGLYVLLTLSVLSVAVYLVLLSERITSLQISWQASNQSLVNDTRALHAIIGQMGYTGYIHDYKNYVLRRSPVYTERLDTHLRVYRQNMSLLRNGLSGKEVRELLDTIDATFAKYENKRRYFSPQYSNLSAVELDRLVQVDDASAAQAITRLRAVIEQNNAQILQANNKRLEAIQNLLFMGFFIVLLLVLQTLTMVFYLRRLHKLNRNLTAANKRVDQLIDSSPDALLVVSKEGIILRHNSKAELLFKCNREQLVGVCVDYFVPDHFMNKHEAYRKDFIRSGRTIAMNERRDLQGKRSNGELFDAEISLSTTELSDSIVIILNIRDVSRQRKIERAAQQKNKIEALGHLTAGVAHDFNNILMTISGNTDLTRLAARQDLPQLEGFLDATDDAVTRATQLTSRLLAFGRKQSLLAKEYQLKSIVLPLGDMLRRLLGETIDFTVDCAAELWPVYIDKAQLESAIINLCLNAKHAMPGGGTLAIQAQNITLDHDFCDEFERPIEGNFVELSISDSGEGIPGSAMPHLFEPFFTTKEEGKGSGLGLSMVYGFMNQSKGHIKIYSEQGIGTSVRLFIPVSVNYSGSVPVTAEVDQLPDTWSLRDKCILVIEDDDDVRKIPVLMLSGQGCKVLQASTPEEALDIAKAANSIDLVFSDVILSSKVNGVKLFKQINELQPHAKVLFTTGYAHHALLEQVIEEDLNHVLQKPYSSKELFTEIVKVMNKQRLHKDKNALVTKN